SRRACARRVLLFMAMTAALSLPLGAIRLANTAHADPLVAGEPIAAVATAATSMEEASLNAVLASMQPHASSHDLLRRGADQLRNKQYEEALATLQQVDAKSWSDKDRQNLNELIAKAKQGADQRQLARAEFDQGQAALSANKPAEAVAHFKNAANND